MMSCDEWAHEAARCRFASFKINGNVVVVFFFFEFASISIAIRFVLLFLLRTSSIRSFRLICGFMTSQLTKRYQTINNLVYDMRNVYFMLLLLFQLLHTWRLKHETASFHSFNVAFFMSFLFYFVYSLLSFFVNFLFSSSFRCLHSRTSRSFRSNDTKRRRLRYG